MLIQGWIFIFVSSFGRFWAGGASTVKLGLDEVDVAALGDMAPNRIVCDAGSKELPPSVLNDDFCDCEDGSDEPATSACSHVPNRGAFICPRIDPLPLTTIPASRVGDGVCDCCDGSDETSFPDSLPESNESSVKTICPNDCDRVAAIHAEKMRNTAATFNSGMKLRRLYSTAASALRSSSAESKNALREIQLSLQSSVAQALSDIENDQKNLDALQREHSSELRSIFSSAFGLSDMSDAQLGELFGALTVTCDVDASPLSERHTSTTHIHSDPGFYGGEDDFYADEPPRSYQHHEDRYVDDVYHDDGYSSRGIGEEFPPEEVDLDIHAAAASTDTIECSLTQSIVARSWAAAAAGAAHALRQGCLQSAPDGSSPTRDFAVDSLLYLLTKHQLGFELLALTAEYEKNGRAFYDLPTFPSDIVNVSSITDALCREKPSPSLAWEAFDAICDGAETLHPPHCIRRAELHAFLDSERLTTLAAPPDHLQPLSTSLAAARTRLKEMESELSSLQANISLLDKKIAFFEENNDTFEFGHLLGECFSYTDGKYWYKVKFLEMITQSDVGEPPSETEDSLHESSCESMTGTKLGHYSRISPVGSPSFQMGLSPAPAAATETEGEERAGDLQGDDDVDSPELSPRHHPESSFRVHFDDGDYCGSFGPRSADMFVMCGADNRIVSVFEPSTCYYLIEFESPLGCTMSLAEELGVAGYL
jgi:hypothetical protein